MVEKQLPLSSCKKAVSLDEADVAIHFSTGNSVAKNAAICKEKGVSILIGTTGWTQDLPQVKTLFSTGKIAALYAPNCSMGMLAFFHLVEKLALINHTLDHEPSLLDIHHKEKKDAPSGSSLYAQKIFTAIAKKALPISSIRTGFHPGEHSLSLDSPDETISLSYRCRSRASYAKGALQLAFWLQGKQGFFTLDDVLRSMPLS